MRDAFSVLRRCALGLALGLGSVFLAQTARADVIAWVRDGNGGDVFNGNGQTSNLTVSFSLNGGSAQTVYAAPFALQYSTDYAGNANTATWINFLTYCLEPDEYLNVSATPTSGTLVGSINTTTDYPGAMGTAIARMYQTWFADSLSDPTGVMGAAFQVALWELAYDTGSNLNAGAFKLNTGGAIAAQAAAYLNDANWIATANVGVILRIGSQDLLVEVPEPASLALLGLGLGLLGVARRRRLG